MLKILLCLLLFIQPFGEVLRVPAAGLDRDLFGLQTIVSLCIIIYGIARGDLLRGFKQHSYFILYFIFVLWGGLMTLFSPNHEMVALTSVLQNIYYATFMLVIASQTISPRDIIIIALSYCVGFSLISILSLLDHYHYISLPGFNEAVGSREIMGAYAQERVTNLSGPFSSRTTFANYCGLAMGTSIGLFFASSLLKMRVLMLLAVCFIFLNGAVALASLSRGLLFSPLIAVFYGVSVSVVRFKVRSRLLLPMVVLLVVMIVGLSLNAKYYGILLNFISSLQLTEANADISSAFRFIMWQAVFLDPVVWLFGNGYALIHSEKYMLWGDPHNTFVWLFHIGGLPGIMLLGWTFRRMIFYFFTLKHPVALVPACSILAYLGYGLTHTAWHFSAFWGFLGLVLSLMKIERGSGGLKR